MKSWWKGLVIGWFLLGVSYNAYPLWVNWTNGNSVNALFDNGDYLYVGSSGGLWIIDENTNQKVVKFISSDGLSYTTVSSIKKLQSGKMIYGTYLGATYHDDNGTITDKSDDKFVSYGAGDGIPLYNLHGVPLSPVWDIYVEPSGTGRWYGTGDGVLYHNDKGTPFNKADDEKQLFKDLFYYKSIISIAREGRTKNWYGARKNMSGSQGCVIYHNFNNTPTNPNDDTVVNFKDWNYEMDGDTYSWDDSADPGTGTLLIGPPSDDAYATIYFNEISPSFQFTFYDIQMGGVYVDTNGRLSFYGSGSYYYNYPFPCTLNQCKLVIAPLWNDLKINDDGQTRGIYYRFVTAETRSLVITFWNVEHHPSGATSTFQVILYEGSNEIRFNYMTYNEEPGDPDTAGINFGDGQRYHSISSISNNTAFRFGPIEFGSVEAIKVDSNNKKWYATRWEGIIYHDDKGTPTNKVDDVMVRWTPQELVGSFFAPFYDIAIDPNGGKWYASFTDSGGKTVYHDDNGTPEDKSDDLIQSFDPLSSVWISKIVIDGDNPNINWYGTGGDGVDKHNTNGTPSNPDDDSWAYIKDDEGIGGGVRGIARQSSDKRWISTDEGIFYHDDNGTPAIKGDDTWIQFTDSQHDSLSSPAGGIAIDSSGKKWYGTSSGVTYHDDNGTPLTYIDDKYIDFEDVDYSMTITSSADWLNWADPGNGTVLDFSSCDDATATINLSQTFRFYDVEFDKIVVDTNGRLSFVGGSSVHSNPQFPCVDNPRCQFVMAPFWDDLSLCIPGSGTKDPNRNILYYEGWGILVITFWNLRHYNYSDGNTFQVVLNPNGWIEFNYKNVNDISDETVGMNKGDGGRFNQYTGTLLNNYGLTFKPIDMSGVEDIVIDSSGKKWYGSLDVVYHDDNNTPLNKMDDTMVLFGDDFGITDPVNSIAIHTSSKRWYGTLNGVYYHDDKGTITDKSDDTLFHYTTSNSKLPDKIVNKVYIDSNGNKWYATMKGIAYHNDNGTPTNPNDDTWVIYSDVDGLLSLANFDIAYDPTNGQKWYGGWGGLSFHNDGSTPEDKSDDVWFPFKPPDDEIASLEVNKILIDPSTAHWIGTDMGISYRTNHFSSLSAEPLDYSIKLTWTVKGNSFFPSPPTMVRVYRSLSLSGDYKLIHQSSCLSSCSWTDEDFLNGQTHYYWFSVICEGKEYRDKLDRVYARPNQSIMPRFYFYAVDPPRSGDVGDYVDYSLYVVPVDGFNSPVTFSLKSGYTLPSGLTGVFIPQQRLCEGGPPCSYMNSNFRVYINSYPTSGCDFVDGARCVIELQAVGGSQTKYENVLLNVRNVGTQSYITHFFYPDPDAEEVYVQGNVEVRGNVFPRCANQVVTSKFTPPEGRGYPVDITGVTDEDGWFSIKYRPPYAGLWHVLTSWGGGCGYSGSDTSNQPQLSPPDLPVSKADTTINISTDADENTQAGDTITITVKIFPNPGAVPVHMKVLNPNGSIALSSTFNTNPDGTFSFGQKAVSGYMRVIGEWSGNVDYNGTSSELIVPVAVPIGMGIIVEGRDVSSVTQETIDNLIKVAYKTLRNRNIPDSRIYLLYNGSLDADGDSDNDVDADSTKANLQNAIETWASSMVSIGNPPSECETPAPYKTPLSIYFIGYGSRSGATEVFYLATTSQIVYETEVNTYLNNLYSNISDRYSSECSPPVSPPSSYPVNVVMDFRYSGGFIPNINGADRILLSSVNSSQSPNFASNGNVSYSAYFFEGIDAGKYIHPAHAGAVDILGNKFSNQDPQIDADGDGVANELNDELQAAQERLEYRTGPNMPPIVQGVKGAASLVQNETPPPTSMQLWCVVEDKEDSSSNLSVKALINPPANAHHETQGLINLYPSSPTFSGTYNGFYGGGTYTVMYIATDSYGNSAVAKTSYVTVNDSVAPDNVGSVSAVYEGDGNFFISWPSASSPDRQGYTLVVTRDGNPYDVVDVGDVLNYTYHVNDPGTYVFTVKTYDRVPNSSSGTSSEPIYTVTDVLYLSALRRGENMSVIWEVADKDGVVGYDIFGSDRIDGGYMRLNGERIPFTGGVESVLLNGGDINFIYLYIYYSDGSIVTSGPYGVSEGEPGLDFRDRIKKENKRLVIVADYRLWDVFSEYISYREKEGFDVEIVTRNYSYGGEVDYLMEVRIDRDEVSKGGSARVYGVLNISSGEDLRSYLDAVMDFESVDKRALRVYASGGFIWYEYEGGYKIGFMESVSEDLDDKVVDEFYGDSKVLGSLVLFEGDRNLDIDKRIMGGDLRFGDLIDGVDGYVIGDPLLYIPKPVLTNVEKSFGCEVVRGVNKSFILILSFVIMFLTLLKKWRR